MARAHAASAGGMTNDPRGRFAPADNLF